MKWGSREHRDAIRSAEPSIENFFGIVEEVLLHEMRPFIYDKESDSLQEDRTHTQKPSGFAIFIVNALLDWLPRPEPTEEEEKDSRERYKKVIAGIRNHIARSQVERTVLEEGVINPPKKDE